MIGAVVVPPEFAPQKWGEPNLDEVMDAKGNDLKVGDSDSPPSARYYAMQNGDDEENTTNTSLRQVVSFGFRPPDWKINEIARIKGTVSLQYFGGAQVVKLTNGVPAKWISDASKTMSGDFDSSEKPLNSTALAALGMSLSLQTGMVQSGMTMLTLQAEGKQAALKDAQVFDADGRPWPTFLQQQNFGGSDDADTWQIVIAGKPQPPLSLALLASGSGATVDVPILLEHVAAAK